MFLGLFVYNPRIVAPAINAEPSDLPSLFPFLFITIACGAISGFHNLVSSGTTAKQINSERDARFIGYGGMLMEGVLAVLVILASTAGVVSLAVWRGHYQSWQLASGLEPKLNAFISGAGLFLQKLGIPPGFAITFMTVMVVSFAMTTLDSATRLLRYNIEELGKSFKLKFAINRYLASFIAVLAISYFALMKVDGKPAGIILWQLFGTTNQLLAGLGLLTVSIFLIKLRRPSIYTLLPMAFMLFMTITAMVLKIADFWSAAEPDKRSWPLLIVGSLILVMALWLLVEALISIKAFYVSYARKPSLVETELQNPQKS
jgi:carbon starvation protein